MVYGFVVLGLIESHAVFACYPLIIAALSGPVLGERAGWRRWLAIGVGFLGVLVILRPGVAVVSPARRDPASGGLHVRALRGADPPRGTERPARGVVLSGPARPEPWR